MHGGHASELRTNAINTTYDCTWSKHAMRICQTHGRHNTSRLHLSDNKQYLDVISNGLVMLNVKNERFRMISWLAALIKMERELCQQRGMSALVQTQVVVLIFGLAEPSVKTKVTSIIQK